MKKVFIFLCLAFYFLPANAQNLNKMSEEEQMGTLAGMALACNAGQKLADYELICARLIANKSATEQIENEKVKIYTQAKWSAMNRQKKEAPVSCSEVLKSFNDLPLLNATVYGNGAVKLPDGTLSKPLRPVPKVKKVKKTKAK